MVPPVTLARGHSDLAHSEQASHVAPHLSRCNCFGNTLLSRHPPRYVKAYTKRAAQYENIKDNRSALVDYIAAVQISGGVEKSSGTSPLNMAVDRILQTMGQAAAKAIMDDRVGQWLGLDVDVEVNRLFCALASCRACLLRHALIRKAPQIRTPLLLVNGTINPSSPVGAAHSGGQHAQAVL